jgi:DNA repair protein RadD
MKKESPTPAATGNRASIGFAENTSFTRPDDEKQATPLWEFQTHVIAKVAAEIATGKRKVIVVSPTGSGKTVMATALIRTVARGGRVLFLDHRRELTAQCSRKLHAAGIDHGIIQAGFPSRPGERVQVASVQSLHARAIRGSAMDMPEADLVIVDEAHHVRARTYQRIIEAYPDAIIIGLTATPCRADGRGLGNVFETMVEAPQIAELIELGHLVPTTVYAPSRPDLTGVAVRRGDYVETELAARVDTQKLVGDIVEHWHRLAERRRTVVFATGVKHSVHIRDEFRRAGVAAAHIDGTTPLEERDLILKQLAEHSIDVVVNCAVLTEGWDCPEVSCLVLARPTKSLGLFRQMVGRVLRTAPGKVDALIIDHAGAVFAHGKIEEPVIWPLHEDAKAENPALMARARFEKPELTTCPECSAVRWSGQPCPVCGWRPTPKAMPVEVEAGDLVKVESGRTAKGEQPYDPLLFYRELVAIGRARNRNPYWARHTFKAKFGFWPPFGEVDPLTPTPAVLAYARSRDIAYAKAKGRTR